MATIGYQNIEDVLLNIADPNTGGTISNVPWVSSPKINATTSIYNVEADGGIAWWSTNVQWSSSDYNTVAWSSWYIYMPDGTQLSVSSGNTGNMSGMTYIYYDIANWTVWMTTQASQSVGEDKIILCVAKPTTSGKSAEFQAFGTGDQSTFITASNIAANTITGNEIYANSITSSEIATWAITTSKIDAWAVTAGKIDVNTLSAITANLWDVHVWATSGSGVWIRIYPNSSTDGRMDFYYNGSVVGRMVWGSYSWVWDAVLIYWGGGSGTIWLLWTTICVGKLKIPVWTNLYD